MFHETLTLLALIAFMLVIKPAAAADRLVDGVPLPGDAQVATVVETDPAELRQWAGVWVGAWGGTLKHVLLVEFVAAGGAARVVYAIGDNPWFGIRRAWSRHEATVAGRRLTISEAGFSATYDLNDEGGLSATYTRGQIVSRAAMTKTDLATLTVPGAVVAWTRGKSELMQTALVEDGKPVDLEVVIFRPKGAGPFPLAVFNHGSTGRGITPLLFTETLFDVGLADFLNDRGWIVAFPQRRGRGRSGGLYDEGFSADRRQGYTCDFDTSLSGAERALTDIAAAMAALKQRPDVAPSRVLIGGSFAVASYRSLMLACTRIRYLASSILWAAGWEPAATPRAASTARCLSGERGLIGRRFGYTAITTRFMTSSIAGTTLPCSGAQADEAPLWNWMCPVGMVTSSSVLLSCGRDRSQNI